MCNRERRLVRRAWAIRQRFVVMIGGVVTGVLGSVDKDAPSHSRPSSSCRRTSARDPSAQHPAARGAPAGAAVCCCSVRPAGRSPPQGWERRKSYNSALSQNTADHCCSGSQRSGTASHPASRWGHDRHGRGRRHSRGRWYCRGRDPRDPRGDLALALDLALMSTTSSSCPAREKSAVSTEVSRPSTTPTAREAAAQDRGHHVPTVALL